VGNDGAEALARALEKNTKLEALVLWNNKITDKGADSLLRALDTNLRLSKLYLTGNSVSPEKLREIKGRLSHGEVTRRRKEAELRGSDCAVGEWAAWSECEGPCGTQGFRHRDREIFVPQSGKGRKCPTLEEVKPCETSACPKDPLTDFMRECGLTDFVGVAEVAKDVLGATDPTDLFELDKEDLGELGLKVAQRKKLIRCVCDASGDKAPCCDDHKGRHHSSVEDIMKLAEVVRRGDVMATDGVDCQGALDLYEESLTLAKSMAAHNFFGEISFKIFLVKTRCHGHRTPTRDEAEKCGDMGIELLLSESLVEDFRRGVSHGWSRRREEAASKASKGLQAEGEEHKGVLGIAAPGRPQGEADEAWSPGEEPMAGLHWSSWYGVFGTTAESCNRASLDMAWSALVLRFDATQAYRHSWTSECANLASILVSAGRELLLEMTPCGARSGKAREL